MIKTERFPGFLYGFGNLLPVQGDYFFHLFNTVFSLLTARYFNSRSATHIQSNARPMIQAYDMLIFRPGKIFAKKRTTQ
jgi:hypothetical protein